MKKLLAITSVIALGACTYGNPVNNEKFFMNADITSVDWSKVNASADSCQTNILYMIPFGDNSVPAAVEEAKIKQIAYIDTDTRLYPLVSRECTNVWGISDSDSATQKIELPNTASNTEEK